MTDDRADTLTDREELLSGRQFSGVDYGMGDVLDLLARARFHESKADYFRNLAGDLIEKMAGDGFAPAPDAAG